LTIGTTVLRGEGTTCETTTPPMSLPKRGEQRIDPDHREGHEAAGEPTRARLADHRRAWR
jgi:hypothetical protein